VTQTSSGDTPEPPGIKPGRPWGTAASGPPDLEVSGGDAALASMLTGAVADPVATVLGGGRADPLVRFVPGPDSDLARAVGLGSAAGAAAGMALPLDALMAQVGDGSPLRVVVNSVVVGVAPDRLRSWHRSAGLQVEVDGKPIESAAATTLVVMNGQYLRGLDLSPRGHPGDGVAEAQLYALPPGARRAMRTRLPTGAHLPHPAITVRRAHHVVVRAARPVPLEIDGAPAGPVTGLEITLRPGAYRLLV
jgi:YegS C-terminal NAD kinase beta sandwich-like domain